MDNFHDVPFAESAVISEPKETLLIRKDLILKVLHASIEVAQEWFCAANKIVSTADTIVSTANKTLSTTKAIVSTANKILFAAKTIVSTANTIVFT